MDEWRNRLTEQLLGQTDSTPPRPDPIAALDLVLGHARSEMTYVIELGRTHDLPVAGSLTGDDIWLRVGATSLRFNFSRRAGVIVASIIGREDQQLKYSMEKRAVITPDGEPLDTSRFVREAIDATVNAWKASGRPGISISRLKSERPPLPTIPDSTEILPKS